MTIELSFKSWNGLYDDKATRGYHETPTIEKWSIEYLRKTKSGKPCYKYIGKNGIDLMLVFTKDTLEVIKSTGDSYSGNTYVDFYNVSGDLPKFISKDL